MTAATGDSTDHEAAHRYRERPFARAIATESVIGRLARWAAAQPEAPYLTAVARNGSAVTVSYGDTAARCGRLAAWLGNELALRPGDTVALLPGNDLPSVIAILGALHAGLTIFLLNPAEPEQRRAELLGAVAVRAVLAPDARTAERCAGAVVVPARPAVSGDQATRAPAARSGGEASLLFGTSGSTAASKIVAQAGYNAAVNAEALRRHHGLAPGVRVLGCLPIHHVNGLHFTLLATMWSGAHAILLESAGAAHYPRSLADHRPAIASVVPSLLETLLLGARRIACPRELRYFVTAAAPLATRTCAAVVAATGVRVVQGYGLTETTNFSTTLPADLPDDVYRSVMIDAEIPTVGAALFGNEVAVLRDDGSRAQPGERGELCMRGHNVMLGYHGNPEATREAFRSGWFHSQDLGHELVEPRTGHSLYVITGRQKNMAKVLGQAVSLEEMERVLTRLPGVADAACFTVPDQVLGEAVIAVVASSAPIASAELTAHLRGHFEVAALPRRYVHTDRLPRTATGKLLRAQLALRFAPAAVAPPRSP